MGRSRFWVNRLAASNPPSFSIKRVSSSSFAEIAPRKSVKRVGFIPVAPPMEEDTGPLYKTLAFPIPMRASTPPTLEMDTFGSFTTPRTQIASPYPWLSHSMVVDHGRGLRIWQTRENFPQPSREAITRYTWFLPPILPNPISASSAICTSAKQLGFLRFFAGIAILFPILSPVAP